MVRCSTPFVLLEVETEGHSEELLSNCKYAFISQLSIFLLELVCRLILLCLALQKPERVDDRLVNEMLRAVSS
jgi:hypothetical protein